MKSKRRRARQANDPNPMTAASARPKPTLSRRESRQAETERNLGPYEARYDIALGYGIERPIVTT